MGLSRQNSTPTRTDAKAYPSSGNLYALGKTSSPTNGVTTNGVGHDVTHSAAPSINTSTPSSPAGSIGSGADGKEFKFFDHVNGPTSPDKAVLSAKEKSDKNPMSRLTRMFSATGRDKKEKDKELVRKHGGEQQHSGATSPMPRHPEKDGEYSSDTDGAQSRGSSVAGDPQPKSRNTSGQHKNGDTTHFVRFEMLENGEHVHHLRAAKRQEKLSTLLQSWLGGKKKEEDGAAPARDQLSLMHSWVDQWKTEKIAAIKKDGAPASATLVEKYGRCQEIIGRGAFGVVRISHKADPQDSSVEQLYAVKEFRRRPQESVKKYTKRLTSEFCISSSLRHPNVIHTLDLLKDAKGDYCEVMEYCAGGDLYTLILAAGKLDVIEADCYFKQLMGGVDYMHDMGVAHRDLKPENLLLTQNGSLKITDFGNGECFRMAWEKEAHLTAGLCGSAPYIAPEEYTDKEFDPRAVDVWACGVIYMAMRTGRHLWRMAKRDEDEFYERYLEGRRDEAGYEPIESLSRVSPYLGGSDFKARCRNVIYSILDPNPSRRITARQVLNSEWGREIKVCKAGREGVNRKSLD
jgi:protein-serine/threonine kinase